MGAAYRASQWASRVATSNRRPDAGLPSTSRSFRVSRGLKPTTLYLCAGCVGELCLAGGIPAPGTDE